MCKVLGLQNQYDRVPAFEEFSVPGRRPISKQMIVQSDSCSKVHFKDYGNSGKEAVNDAQKVHRYVTGSNQGAVAFKRYLLSI